MTDLKPCRWRKKPVVIEAWCVEADMGGCPKWLTDELGKSVSSEFGPRFHIDTLEGRMTAMPGDWIIKGVKGELYPCKPDIFAATYEPADSAMSRAPAGVVEDDLIPRSAVLSAITEWFGLFGEEQPRVISAKKWAGDAMKDLHDYVASIPARAMARAPEVDGLVICDPRSLRDYPFLPCPICKGVEGCDHSVPERARAALAAPAKE